jgi:hypothetical protein
MGTLLLDKPILTKLFDLPVLLLLDLLESEEGIEMIFFLSLSHFQTLNEHLV